MGSAKFEKVGGIAVDGEGNILVADSGDHRIRKVTPGGLVTTVAGGERGFADGEREKAQFNHPSDITLDGEGNIFVADTGRIRKVAPDGVVTTVATDARISDRAGIAVDGKDNIFVTDGARNIFKVMLGVG